MKRLLFVALLAAACSPADAPAPAGGTVHAAADGAVLMVEDVPILPDEVDRVAAAIGELHPEYVQRQRRRLALTNVCLPRAAARALHPAERERAQAEALAAAAALAAGEPPPRPPEATQGNWHGLGLAVWIRLRATPVGRWSEPFEDVGRFVLVRPLAEPSPVARVGQERYELEILSFPYLAPTLVDRAVDECRLAVVDDAWGELVPEAWKHRMRGTR